MQPWTRVRTNPGFPSLFWREIGPTRDPFKLLFGGEYPLFPTSLLQSSLILERQNFFPLVAK
jgi:hypothetical protein